MPSITVENYVKQIYLEHQASSPRKLVPMGRLAAAVGVTAGTATTMIKMLSDAGLVAYQPRGGVRLTTKGEKLALHVLRRHRLVELFLVTVLHLDWSEVHDEAEELEHSISERLLEKIDEYLGRPAFDPHGDPIPSADGKVTHRDVLRLADVESGQHVRIARVVDQDERFLKFVERQGLKPGARITIETRDTLADAISIRLKEGKLITLGTTAAGKILVAT